jgi:heptosyltransferase-1
MAERFLIVRLGAMGDIIHSLPAAAALRRAQPTADIGWAIEDRWVELLSTRAALGEARGPAKPLPDRIHLVNTRAWREAMWSDETWREAVTAMKEIRSFHYETAFDFQGAWKSAAVAFFSRAKRRVGFNTPREGPASILYNRRVSWQGTHVVEQAMCLAEAFGASARPEEIMPDEMFPRDAAAERWGDEQLAAREIRDFVILNPGAGWGAKQWPPERYAEVARALAFQGLRSIVNHGPTELALANEVTQLSAGAAVPVACSIGELMALTRRAKLFIGGDTGPMHLAAALRVPVVALFGPTNPERNGPFATRSVVLRSPESETSYRHTSRAHAGLLSINVADVLKAATSLLEAAHG